MKIINIIISVVAVFGWIVVIMTTQQVESWYILVGAAIGWTSGIVVSKTLNDL